MKKTILTLFICFITILAFAEKIEINGLILKKIKNTTKNHMLSSSFKRQPRTKFKTQIITIKYIETDKRRRLHKFKISIKEDNNIKSFIYYMKDEDTINFTDFKFRLIEFKNIFWFKIKIH